MKESKIQINQHFETIFNTSPNPMYVCAGDNFHLVYANDATLQVWGKDRSIIGKPIVEALPEIRDQRFLDLLHDVYKTGIPYHSEYDKAEIKTGESTRIYYFNFTYQPLREDEQTIWGVLCTATDVTELVLAKKEVEIGQNNFREMIMQAPVAICIVKVPEFVVEIANERVAELWGTTLAIIGKPIFEVLPELRGQGFEELLHDVYTTGIRITASERPADLPRNGKVERAYLNFVYEPVRAIDGKIRAIMAVAIDVTEQVVARKRKDDFIGVASHELRTPLTSLRASIQLIERYSASESNNNLSKLIKQSSISVNRLKYLVEDLLSITRLNAGQLNLNKETFTLSKLFEECCQYIRMQGTHEVIVEGDLDLQVHADLHRIDQVVINLINNVVKYAPESRQIFILIERLPGYAKVSIKDKGPGIPEEEISHIFKRYYRVDKQGKQISGLGLGLFISNEIIVKHGGEMGVESEVGKGSRFWFTLPL